jgi:hypothetical protein
MLRDLEKDPLAFENNIWSGGPEAYQHQADRESLIVFTEMAGVMSNSKSAEKGRWRDGR